MAFVDPNSYMFWNVYRRVMESNMENVNDYYLDKIIKDTHNFEREINTLLMGLESVNYGFIDKDLFNEIMN